MTTSEIIELGTKLGLLYDEKTNHKDYLRKNIVVFDGINNQKFLIDGMDTDEVIYQNMGESLILMGKRLKAIEMANVMSTLTDY